VISQLNFILVNLSNSYLNEGLYKVSKYYNKNKITNLKFVIFDIFIWNEVIHTLSFCS
jgi:hypothetical protein